MWTARLAARCVSMPDKRAGPYDVLFDSSNAEVVAVIEKGLSTGDVLKGVSIEELADAAGAPQLAATFEAYQQAAAAGADEAFGKKADMLAAYGDGPFYLVKFVPSYVATMGGVKTDASCQALGENGSVIPGLFAVGEATHRFMYNRSFVRHCSNSSALTMGRLTGAALATAERPVLPSRAGRTPSPACACVFPPSSMRRKSPLYRPIGRQGSAHACRGAKRSECCT